jgi:2-amino-4-hydroxy-6-hydroxymethyldihydropteridine diphosphokinase
MPADLDVYIKDRAAAIRLGKALFWDMQVGSAGQACASCHYNAGADSRSVNQLNPGPDARFDTTHSNNFQLKLDTHFPLTKFTNALDVTSPKIRSRNDIVGSQGVFKADFVGLTNGAFGVGSFGAEDSGVVRPDALFTRSGVNTRQVTNRNSPSVINAVFNHRNFWDGRAHNEFNGVNPYGDSDVNARVYETDPVGGPEQPAYLNAVFVGETTLEPHALLTCAQSIETDWHRTREVRWGPRTLDIDIITMGAIEVTSDVLTLPHPRAHERAFVCRPLLDADPSARIGDQSVAEIMTTLSVDGVRLTDFTLDAGWGER